MGYDQRAALRRRFLNAATADGSGGLRTTGVRWWLKYVVLIRGLEPRTRLSAASSLIIVTLHSPASTPFSSS